MSYEIELDQRATERSDSQVFALVDSEGIDILRTDVPLSSAVSALIGVPAYVQHFPTRKQLECIGRVLNDARLKEICQ